MRFVSYQLQGWPGFGLVVGNGVVDLRVRRLGNTLKGVIAEGRLEQARKYQHAEPDYTLASLTLEPPIPDPHKILAVGANYADHAAEMQREVGADPVYFARFTTSIVGQGQPIIRPRASLQLDYEGELAVIIGRPGRHIREEDALSWVAGYTLFNDGTIRDYQRTSLLAGKNFDCSGAMGPWLATPDELKFPLLLETRVNGERRQYSTTDRMIFAIPRLIEYASRFVALQPGDVIATGTPAGVGARRKPAVWLAPGDRVEIDAPGLGVLSNPICDEAGGN